MVGVLARVFPSMGNRLLLRSLDQRLDLFARRVTEFDRREGSDAFRGDDLPELDLEGGRPDEPRPFPFEVEQAGESDGDDIYFGLLG